MLEFTLLAEPDTEAFERSLSETIAWCNRRLDMNALRTCFRSTELHPAFNPQIRPMADCSQYWVEPAVNKRVIEKLISDRRELLGDVKLPTPGDLAGGRLLLYSNYDALEEGACALATNGYFDDREAPP